MPVQPPSTIDQFLELVRKSYLVEKPDLDAFLQQTRSGTNLPTTTGKMAGALVRAGLLTHFQAEQLLQGKHRGFTISGRYKILEKLGAGGMGSVFLCEHKIMRRRVAVKMLPASQAAIPAAVERFHREARAAAVLDHPNIVRAHEVDQDGKLHFLVMEHVDGASLQEIVKGHGPMDVFRAAHYIRQSAAGLQHAHQAGLVHRDIKPGNLLLDRTGTIKVLDMGLALFFNDPTDNLTKEHDSTSVLGTADYLAPEQAVDSHGVDIRADIYSLGATFYFLLTGKSPFSEGTLKQKLIWSQLREPESIRTLRPEVPEGLVAVIERMMAKEPTDRYQTPTEVVEALTPWTQEPIGPPPEDEMPRLSLAAGGSGFPDSQVKLSKPASGQAAPSSAQRALLATRGPRGPQTTAARAEGPATGRAVQPLSSSGSGKAAVAASPSPRTRILSGQGLADTDLAARADTDRHDPRVQAAPATVASRRLRWYAVGATLAAVGLGALAGIVLFVSGHGTEPNLRTNHPPPPDRVDVPAPPTRAWVVYDRPDTLRWFAGEGGGELKGDPGMTVQRLAATGSYPAAPSDPRLPVWPTPRPVLVISAPQAWAFCHPLQDPSLGQRILGQWQRLAEWPPVRPQDNLLKAGTFDGDCLALDYYGRVTPSMVWRAYLPKDLQDKKLITLATPPDRPGNQALLLMRQEPDTSEGRYIISQALPLQKPGTVLVLRYRARAEEGNGRISIVPRQPFLIPESDDSSSTTQLRARCTPIPKNPSVPPGGYWYEPTDWVTPTAAWQSYYLIWEWPPFAPLDHSRTVLFYFSGLGKIWLDDLELFVWESGSTR